MSNCCTHDSRTAVYNCDRCNKPICESCYNNFVYDDQDHFCSDCYKEIIYSAQAEVKSVRSMVIRELVFIIIGLIVGLIGGLYFCFSTGETVDTLGPVAIIIPIYLPFVCGSLLTIVKKVRNSYLANRDESGGEYAAEYNFLTLFALILFSIIGAPITTIVRFIQRIVDIVKLNQLIRSGNTAIALIEDFIQQSLQPSAVMASAEGGATDVEISLDAILASNAGSEAALCDNGEILRTIRSR